MSSRERVARAVKTLLSEYHFAKYTAKVCKEMRGATQRCCPLCGYEGTFLAFGIPPRFDACCPRCASLERHRLLFLCDLKKPIFTDEIDLLHFAPEPSVTSFIKPKVKRYRTADLKSGGFDLRLNVEAIALADATVDLVLASHILEHVDDSKALREIHRILRPNGRAILMFPVVEGWDTTYEDPQVVTSKERNLHFGQWDHVRYYGRDARDRIVSAGFQLGEFCASPAECIKYGLQRGERVFIATKS